MSGPLKGVKIIEIAAIGPTPFCGMMLADHGAEVVRIDRPGGTQGGIATGAARDVLGRSRKSIVVDMKKPEGVALVRDLVKNADGLIEGFRPGVMERLGLEPENLLKDNPALVYGRMTGWGQTGPYSQAAGHDINYIALAGALHAFGRKGEKPTPPVNMIGDFGGGGMMLSFSMVAAILHARATGQGQVIDCAMTEGAAVLMSMVWQLRAEGNWQDERGTNILDTGAHFYDSYETLDGKYISVGPIEPQFYADFRARLGVEDDVLLDNHMDAGNWDTARSKLATLFKTRTRDEWCDLLEHTDACFAPVLSLAEAPLHPHNVARSSFVNIDGIVQPAPAPQYSVTKTDRPKMTASLGADTEAVLRSLGYDEARISSLRETGAVE